jgi:hypothetical protein
MPGEITAVIQSSDIQSSYNYTISHIRERASWYAKRAGVHRFGSALLRLFGFAAFCAGVVQPLLDGSDNYRFAYLALAIGGLILLADQTFMFSNTWVRYIKARLALEAAADQLEAEWKLMCAVMANASPTEQQAMKLLADSTASANAIVMSETTQWQGELEAAIKHLSDEMTKARDDAATRRAKVEEQAAENRRKAEEKKQQDDNTKKAGSLNLTVSSTKETLKNVEVKIDGKDLRKSDALPTTFGYRELAPGFYHITIGGLRQDQTPMPEVSQVVEIKPGELQITSIKLPY